jgi:hypothetical protein
MLPSIAMHRLVGAVVLAAALASGAGLCLAESNQWNVRGNQFQQNRPVLDLPAFQAEQRRLNFQAQQQRYRDDDRANIGRSQQPNLYVPRMRTGCQAPLRGNGFVGDCR